MGTASGTIDLSATIGGQTVNARLVLSYPAADATAAQTILTAVEGFFTNAGVVVSNVNVAFQDASATLT